MPRSGYVITHYTAWFSVQLSASIALCNSKLLFLPPCSLPTPTISSSHLPERMEDILTLKSSKAARSSPPVLPPRLISYHCSTGVRASVGSSFTMGWAFVRPRNSGFPWKKQSPLFCYYVKFLVLLSVKKTRLACLCTLFIVS